jgi:hypothetical protein
MIGLTNEQVVHDVVERGEGSREWGGWMFTHMKVTPATYLLILHTASHTVLVIGCTIIAAIVAIQSAYERTVLK